MPRLTLLACLVAFAGCRPADEIRTYTVPKPKDQPPATPAGPGIEALTYYVDVAGPTDRLLGALIKAPDGRFYSLKLSGPAAEVAQLAAAFRGVAESVRLSDNPADPLLYTLPAGWKRKPPTNQFRLATLATGGPEVGVFLPLAGSLLDNVNRWRQQVGAAPVTEAELPTAAPELKLGGPPN